MIPTSRHSSSVGLLRVRPGSEGPEVLDANRAAAELLGTTVATMQGRALSACPGLAGAGELPELVHRVAHGPVSLWRTEIAIRTDRVRIVEVTLTCTHSVDGTTVVLQLVETTGKHHQGERQLPEPALAALATE